MILGHAGVIWEARGFKEILSFIHMKSNMPIIQVLFKTSCSSQMKKNICNDTYNRDVICFTFSYNAF